MPECEKHWGASSNRWIRVNWSAKYAPPPVSGVTVLTDSRLGQGLGKCTTGSFWLKISASNYDKFGKVNGHNKLRERKKSETKNCLNQNCFLSSFDSCWWLRFCFCFLNFIIGTFYPLRLLTEQRKAESGAIFLHLLKLLYVLMYLYSFFVAVKCQQAILWWILCGFTRETNVP